MSEVIKVKLAILITLFVQTVGLAYFFGQFKTAVEHDIRDCSATIKEVRREQSKRTYLVYKVEELIKNMERLERRLP